jgi:hypothetical protein
MIRHYVARRAKVIFDHPHNGDERVVLLVAELRLLDPLAKALDRD